MALHGFATAYVAMWWQYCEQGLYLGRFFYTMAFILFFSCDLWHFGHDLPQRLAQRFSIHQKSIILEELCCG